MSKRKYMPTKRICSLADFERSKATWFEVLRIGRKKMWHRGALESLQVHTLSVWIYKGMIFECEMIEKEEKDVK